MLTLGIDSSTQSCSALVIDVELGKVVAEATVNFGERLPSYGAPNGFLPDLPDGQVQADPRMWLDALELLLDDLRERCDLSRIRAISGAAQQHGSVYLKANWLEKLGSLEAGTALSVQLEDCFSRSTAPIWMDTSTTAQCREIARSVGGDTVVCAKSGSVAIERFAGPQIRRFYEQDADGYEGTARIHLISSFFASLLCGNEVAIDTGDGAGMNLLNINNWSWDADLLEATAPNLGSRLPAVQVGESRVGEVAAYFVDRFGFQPGTPVAVFTGDNPSSLVGMGAARPGKVVVSLGTSDTFFAAMPRVVADPQGCGHVFGNPLGGSMSLQCFVNGSLAREAVKDRFGYSWDAFTEALDKTIPGNDGDLMVPFFRPEISPRMEIHAPILAGRTAFLNWEDGAAAVRACVEGQFLNMKLSTEWMQLEPETVYLTGGASANDAIAQVAADIFQARVERLSVTSSVALGAAMRAASVCLSRSIEELESHFCSSLPGSERVPNDCGAVYPEAASRFRELLRKEAS